MDGGSDIELDERLDEDDDAFGGSAFSKNVPEEPGSLVEGSSSELEELAEGDDGNIVSYALRSGG